MYGTRRKKLWEGQHGVVRTTYLIDEEGMIVQAYDKSKTAQNPAQMLACI